MPLHADVVIIGAGIVGASTAYQLAKAGKSVVMVDKAAGAGYGSSSASSGVVRFEYSTFPSTVVAWEAAHQWADLRGYLGAPADEALAWFEKTGKILLDTPLLSREVQRDYFDRIGIPYQELTADEVVAMVPAIDPGRFWPPKPIDDDHFWDEPAERLGAVYTPDAGFIVDTRLACENFANAAIRQGARLVARTRITGIEYGGGVWTLTGDTGETFAAPVVVNAAGPWSPVVNALAGVGAEFTITTAPMRQEVHPVAPPPGYHPEGRLGPALYDSDLGYYSRPELSGDIIVGSAEPACDQLEWVEGDVDAVNYNRTAEAFERQVTRLARRLPGLAIPPRPSGVVGVYDVATDWTPIYDKTDAPGFYVAIGTSGNQFKNGPMIGEIMAAVMAQADRGIDHDVEPAKVTGAVSGIEIDLGFFSRKRPLRENSASFMG